MRALPPEALLPGQIPAHDARCAGVGNTVISTPISAIMPIAHFRATPGIVCTRSMIGSKVATRVVICSSISASWASRKSTCARIWANQHPVMVRPGNCRAAHR